MTALLLWGLLPGALTLFTLLRAHTGGVHFAGDFHYAFWPAGQRVLHGLSPYVDPGSPVIAHATAFVYPALAALLLAPLALIPRELADVLFAGVQIGAVLLTLRVLNVRDWRLYGLVMLCPAVFSGWSVANVTLLLGLGLALAWRLRERPLPCGFLTAVLISLKLFLWPLLLWLALTRRWAALGYAAVCGVALNILSWAVLGVDELGRYGRLLHAVASAEERRGYSLVSLARAVGMSKSGAYAIALVSAAGLLAVAMRLPRRGSDMQILALAIGASLLATPIVQLHYFALLIVPLAVAFPRLCWAWALPLSMWVATAGTPAPWQLAASLAITGLTLLILTWPDALTEALVRLRGKAPARPSASGLDLRLAPPTTSSVAARDLPR